MRPILFIKFDFSKKIIGQYYHGITLITLNSYPIIFYNYPVITVYVVNFSITLHVPYFCLYCTKTVPFSSSSNHNDYYCNNDTTTTTTTTINNNYINNNNDDDDDNSIGGGFFKADIWWFKNL